MVIDASALVTILLREPEWDRVLGAILKAGDCFAYALAKTHGDGALLYKGDDFPRTDIASALAAPTA